MTPGEKNIVRSLVAVAWADGKLEAPESGVIEGLLCGFDATPEEEQEILDYAKSRREVIAWPASVRDAADARAPGRDAHDKSRGYSLALARLRDKTEYLLEVRDRLRSVNDLKTPHSDELCRIAA